MDRFIKSRTGLRFVLSLAHAMPPRFGYTIADLVAQWISFHRDSALVRAVRSNQWIVGGEPTRKALDQSIKVVFKNSARSIYDLYHYIQDLGSAGQRFIMESSVQEFIHRPKFDRRGLIVAGLHMSGFDLALQWICHNWLEPLALTIPNPEGGRRLEFEIRHKTVIDLVPGSVNGLRKAIRYLQQGGMVVTGIDRPVADYQPGPRFFGQPTSLPTHHVFLALKAQVPVLIVATRLENDGKYHVAASPPIEMEPYPNRTDELLYNAEKILAVAEGFIREDPHQWLITLPVWPEVENKIPR